MLGRHDDLPHDDTRLQGGGPLKARLLPLGERKSLQVGSTRSHRVCYQCKTETGYALPPPSLMVALRLEEHNKQQQSGKMSCRFHIDIKHPNAPFLLPNAQQKRD